MAARDRQSAEHMLGVVLILASTAVFALAGVLTKAIQADAVVVASWRGLFGGLTITLYVLWRRARGGPGLKLDWRGGLLVVVGAAASMAFIAAFKHGYIANVAIIYATVPFVAALLAWLFTRERFRLQTMLAAAVSAAGVAVMVGAGLGGGGLAGHLLAMLMTVLSGLYLVLVRMFRDTPVVWAGAVSAFLLFLLGWLVTDPLAVSSRDMLLLAAFGLSFAVAVVLWTEAARLIPAAEAGLLGAAEVPLAILFAWLMLSELPPSASFVGGAVVLAAVFAHAGLDWWRTKTAEQAAQQAV